MRLFFLQEKVGNRAPSSVFPWCFQFSYVGTQISGSWLGMLISIQGINLAFLAFLAFVGLFLCPGPTSIDGEFSHAMYNASSSLHLSVTYTNEIEKKPWPTCRTQWILYTFVCVLPDNRILEFSLFSYSLLRGGGIWFHPIHSPCHNTCRALCRTCTILKWKYSPPKLWVL